MKRLLLKLDSKNKNFKKIMDDYKVKKIGLFGSFAYGKPKKNSDIDFLVEFKKGADLFDQIGLKLELKKKLHRDVDVVTPNSLSRHFRDIVISKVIYL